MSHLKSLRQLPRLSPLASVLSDAHTWWRGAGLLDVASLIRKRRTLLGQRRCGRARGESLSNSSKKVSFWVLEWLCDISAAVPWNQTLFWWLADWLCWCGSSGATFQCFQFPRVRPRAKRRRLFEAGVNLFFGKKKEKVLRLIFLYVSWSSRNVTSITVAADLLLALNLETRAFPTVLWVA